MSSSQQAAASRLRPYLTTAQLISLAALASPIISLLFVLFRLRSSSDVAQQSVTSAKDSLQASCLAAERAASVGASLPRYLAQGVNEQITDGVRATMEGVRIGLTLSLTATEALIEFVIDIYRSTFLCLLELVVRGGLSVVISAVSGATTFVNNTLSSITSGISNEINAANNVIQTAVNVVKNIPFVGDNINIPQFSIPSASQLSNIQIPTTFEDQLRNLNSSMPTLDELRDKLDSLISIPFQLVKKEINDTFLASQASFIATPLPVPKEATVTFCGDTISTSFDDLARDLLRIARIGFFVLIATMVLLFIGYALLTWYSQRSLRNNIERVRLLWFGEGYATTDRLLAFDALIAHPIWSRIVYFLTEKFHLSQEKYDALTWFGLYVFHPAPMACLLIGIFGILSVQVQLAVIGPLQSHYSSQVSNNINDLTGTIASKLNVTMFQESASYAQSLNEKIIGVETSINSDLFGWVNATIVPLNNTLANFYSEVQGAVETLFGNTPLEAPAQEFIRCLIGTKIIGIENALTFLQQNLQVDLPRVNETALVLSQSNVNEVAKPISAAAVGSGDNGDDGGLVGKIITQYISALEKERITFFIFLLLWGLAVVIALLIMAWHLWILPAMHRRGWKEPRWLAGPKWEDTTAEKNDYSTEKGYPDALQFSNSTHFVAIPSPLSKNAAAASTSAAIPSPDHGQLYQRKASDIRLAGDLDRYQVTANVASQRASPFERLREFVAARTFKHTAKKNSDSAILPFTARSEHEGNKNEWLDRISFWKRDVAANNAGMEPTFSRNMTNSSPEPIYRPTFNRDDPRTRTGSGSRPRLDLTVDVAKAAVPSLQPRVIVEQSDRSMENPTSRHSESPRRGRGMNKPSRQNTDYLTVPPQQTRTNPKPKPPAWVAAALAAKQGLPAIPDEANRDRDDGGRRRPEQQNSNSSSTRSEPRRPPGLSTRDDQERHPSVPKPAVTTQPRNERPRNERRRHGRNSSVPPSSSRVRTDPKRQQEQNKGISRASSLDAVDPFATPMRGPKELPAPMEPVKLQVPALAAKSVNPFSPTVNPFSPIINPFDDSKAVRNGAETQGNKNSYNFSMPSRRYDTAI